MEKEFVPYEQVSSLIALGFNEPVIAHRQNGLDICLLKQPEVLLTDLSMILYQQAFRWFREKYGLEGLILPQSQGAVIDGEPIYFIAIISYENELMKELFNSTNQEDLLHYNPREEAELACLEKLIEIVEQKNEK